LIATSSPVESHTSLGDCRSSSNLAASIQGRKQSLGRYSGQSGSVYVVGDMYVGRYRMRDPETQKWLRKAIPIGPRKEMTKPEAKRKLRELLEQMGVNKTSTLLRSLGGPGETFKQKATRWENTDLIMCKPSSANIPYMIKKHLIPPFGDLPLDSVTEDRVKEWIADQVKQGKLAPKTIHNIWKVLRLILGKKHVVGWDIKLPAIPRKEQRWFTPEEAKQIVDAAEGQFKTLFALQFATGMRIGEICGLHVEDVDLENAIVHIRRSTYKLIESTPKTDAGYRDVDIDQATIQMLKKHTGNRVTGRLFQTKNDTPLVGNNINREVLKPICKKLGIPIGTTHAFRHGRISVLQKARVPGKMITEWVGHTSLKMSQKYTHFSDEERKAEIVRLSNAKAS